MLFVGIVGGLLPDIDSDSSKPLTILFEILSITLPLVALIALFAPMPILKTILAWLLLGLFLRLTLFKLFLRFTRHRGIFHSVAMAVLVGEVAALVLHKLFGVGMRLSAIYGFMLFFGYMIHLILDEIYSINALGLRMKRSFGSALKLYDRDNPIGTLIVYVLIALLYYLYLRGIDSSIKQILHLLVSSLRLF